MNRPVIKLCVFDMAGTLVLDNNNVLKIFRKSFQTQGLTVKADIVNEYMGYEKKYAIQSILKESGIQKNKTKLTAAIYKAFNQMMLEHYESHVKPATYANTAMQKISAAGIKIALNTGFGKTIMKTIINTLEWNEVIDACISSDQVVSGRPYPYMIDHLIKKLKISDSSQVAKIGDTPSDLLEGFNAECGLNIGIYSKNFPKDVLKKHPHTHLVNNLREATDIILLHK